MQAKLANPLNDQASQGAIGLLLINLGTPEAPTPPALRKYLAEFLSDKRIVELPRLLWWLILHGVILRIRPARSASKYKSIWLPEGSPLRVWTQQQCLSLKQLLNQIEPSLIVAYAMRYGAPSIASQLNYFKEKRVKRLLVLPLYPQYSSATTASAYDEIFKWYLKSRYIPELRFINSFHANPFYIKAITQSTLESWRQNGRGELLVISFHGMPEYTKNQGDPYYWECLETSRLIACELGLDDAQYLVAFQSRFGKAAWLKPYIQDTLMQLPTKGVKNIDIICPGFVSDCVETLEEIAIESKEIFIQAGGQKFTYISCLNNHPDWIQALSLIANDHLQGW